MKKKLLSIILSCVILMSTIVPTAYALDVGIYGTPIHFNFGKTYGINVGGLLQDSLAQTAYIYQVTDGLSLDGIFNYAVQFGNYNSDTSSREKYTWSSAKKKIQQDVSDAMDSYLYDQFSKAWALDLTRIRTVDTTTQQVYSFATQDYFNYTACYQSVNVAMAGGQANLAYAYQVLNSCTNSNYAATLRETWYITDVSRPQYLMNFEQTSYLTAAELTALSQYNVTNSGFISSQLGTVQTNNYVESYYQLPDGRNSYDLEPEDVWGTYFIYNATNYREVVEDDGITRGLWHMDGNYKDSSASGVGDLSCSQYDFISDGMGSAARLSSGTSSSISFPAGVDKTSPYTVEFRFKVTSMGDLPSKKIEYSSYASATYTYTYTGVEKGYFTGLFSTAGNYIDCSVGVWYNVAVCYDGSVWHWFLNGKEVNLTRTDFNFNLSNTMNISYKYTCECYIATTHSTSYSTGTEIYKDRPVSVLYDEVRLSNKVLYTEDYTPRTQPFDTNKVLVVPDPATITDTTIAVKSSVPVGALRVGGVRPTFPSNGDVYVVEEKGIVKDVQQYQQDGWYSVQASLYIDGEWKLFVGFDISGFGLNKPDSPGGGTGPGGSGDSGGSGSGGGGSGGGDSGGSSGFWDKLLQSVFGGVLSVLASLLSGLLTLLSTILTMLLGLVGYIGIFLPFLPSGVVTLIGGGVFIVLALIVVKFIGNLL